MQITIKGMNKSGAVKKFLKEHKKQKIYDVTREHELNTPVKQKMWRITSILKK